MARLPPARSEAPETTHVEPRHADPGRSAVDPAPSSSGTPKRAPELRLPYPFLEYLLQLPGDYAKLVLRLLQRAQWTPGATREGLVLDAGEVLISLRSDDVWGAIALDREVNESGRVSLLRRVLRRLRDDGYISIRPTHRRDTARDTQTGTRRDTPATVVRFLNFRDNLWPANEDATRGTTREATRKATHRIGTILAVDPADPFPASATTSSCPAWNDLSAELRRHVRPDLYERWFAPLTASQSGEELVLLAPNPFHKSFVEDNFRAFLEQALATKSRGAVRVRVAAALLS